MLDASAVSPVDGCTEACGSIRKLCFSASAVSTERMASYVSAVVLASLIWSWALAVFEIQSARLLLMCLA
jgi:hypothetical protein